MVYSSGNGESTAPKYFGLRIPVVPEAGFLRAKYAIVGIVTTGQGTDQRGKNPVTPFPWDAFTARPEEGIYSGHNLSYTITRKNLQSPVPLSQALADGLSPEGYDERTMPQVLLKVGDRDGRIVRLNSLEATVNSMTRT
ncbi:hypothetical protein HY640_00610 [Candidatus Woesearchaeota archaeon]|nr:hypothetical protein [Candidatus Woesearchaeota archaeon]